MESQKFYCLRFGVIVVAVSVLGSCLGAPTPPSQKEDHWWYDPCNYDIDKIRHGRSATELPNLVKRHLNLFNVKLNQTMKKIDTLYNDRSEGRRKPTVRLNWLKIKSWTKGIKKAPQDEKLQKFYEALSHFAGTLEALRQCHIETNIEDFNQTERDGIYKKSAYDLRNLMCEVHTRIVTVDEKKVPKVPLKSMKIPASLQKQSLNLTSGHMIDINFFRKTIQFFNRTKSILFQKRKNNKVKKNSARNKKRT